jgi:hypothetical protein
MIPIYAASLGIAAALAGAWAEATAPALEAPPEPRAQPTVEPVRDLLAPELAEAAARLDASDPAKICDDKCRAVVFTQAALPGTGAADLLSVVLEPEAHSLSIARSDGTPALTFTVAPTRILRGEGLVARARF